MARFEIAIDGACGFCRKSAGWLTGLDWLGNIAIRPVDEPGMVEMRITRLADGRTLGGFDGFRMMAWSIPLLAPLWPLLYLPGAATIGRTVYRWVARHRAELPGGCESGACSVDLKGSPGAGSGVASTGPAAGAPPR